jgi:hypothetical protein
MQKAIMLLALFISSQWAQGLSPIDCASSKMKSECTAQLVAFSKNDEFLKAILSAELARLPGWTCDDVSDWKLSYTKSKSAMPKAKATITCQGKEQHLTIDLAGTLELTPGNAWKVRVTSFQERPGV